MIRSGITACLGLMLLSAVSGTVLPSPGPQLEIRTGASRIEAYLSLLQGKRVALLINATSLVGSSNLLDTLLSLGVHVEKVFSPEHGFRGIADAGATVENSIDPATGIPVISLYGPHTTPSAADLSDVDLMVYDIQDVGVRFYTYISSMQRFMEAAARYQKPLIILDRPNPNGSIVDGPVLDSGFRSFVGLQRIPICYGMTIGEYATMLNQKGWLAGGLHCNLRVIRCLNYTHHSIYILPTRPSPNLPDMASVYLYPSLCLFEGTSVSVGRGTSHPFSCFGEPDFPHRLYSFIPRSVPGATDPPYPDDTCYGENLWAPPARVRAILRGHFSLRWLLQAYRLCPDKAKFFKPYFNKLAGDSTLKIQILAGWPEKKIRESWAPDLERFRALRRKYLMYPM
ncbi:MAG TPA: DUF1343 domain-containing protein [Chitinophagaceae bacterium]|nr:DUF1343 domain-containing protein [Chitinophagaceae bacterium]